MKHLFRIIITTAALTLFVSAQAMAAQWIQNGNNWSYQLDDGSLKRNGWSAIDGKEYYFDANGIMLADTITPDGYGLEKSGEKKERLGVYRDKEACMVGETINLTATFGNWDEVASDISWSVVKGDVEIISISADKRNITIVGKGNGEFRVAANVKTKSGMDCRTERGGMILDPITGGWLKNSRGEWMYIENGQYVKNAWRQNKGTSFYLDENGIMVTNKTITLPEGTFTFDAEGYQK